MYTIDVRNVHEALPLGVQHLYQHGIKRDSRNGPVLQAPEPVTTVYRNPIERLTCHPARDVNTAFLVYEALWMLAGRNDLAPILRYVKTFGNFSDDGRTLHGAYGHRWREHFGFDQVQAVISRLRSDATDRRAVLQMWDGKDLIAQSRDLPCNTAISFQVTPDNKLDMTIFCRSNDVVWGAYFANAYHMSVLQEFVALMVGVPVGVYRQVSVNFHGYLKTLDEALATCHENPYVSGDFMTVPMSLDVSDNPNYPFMTYVHWILDSADKGFVGATPPSAVDQPWASAMFHVLRAHHLYTLVNAEEALAYLGRFYIHGDPTDVIASMRLWLNRRVRG